MVNTTEISHEVERNGDLFSRARTVRIRNALQHGRIVGEESERPGNEVTVRDPTWFLPATLLWWALIGSESVVHGALGDGIGIAD
jgi:hypothetical protein